jgi:DNA-binding MarR family transcriptional regulator
LLTVAQQPGISQATSSDQLGLDANTLSSIVSRMLRKRLIRRERSFTDKRRYGLQVTEAGYRQLAQFLPSVGKYQQRVARRLSADEREQLIVLLQRLLEFDPWGGYPGGRAGTPPPLASKSWPGLR